MTTSKTEPDRVLLYIKKSLGGSDGGASAALRNVGEEFYHRQLDRCGIGDGRRNLWSWNNEKRPPYRCCVNVAQSFCETCQLYMINLYSMQSRLYLYLGDVMKLLLY